MIRIKSQLRVVQIRQRPRKQSSRPSAECQSTAQSAPPTSPFQPTYAPLATASIAAPWLPSFKEPHSHPRRIACHAGATPNNTPVNSRGGNRKRHHPPVELHLQQCASRPSPVRKESDSARHAISQRHPQQPAHPRKQQTLRQHLPQDPHPPRSQRKPRAHLPLPRRSPRQQQIRQVYACQHKHQSCQCHQHIRRLSICAMQIVQPTCAWLQFQMKLAQVFRRIQHRHRCLPHRPIHLRLRPLIGYCQAASAPYSCTHHDCGLSSSEVVPPCARGTSCGCIVTGTNICVVPPICKPANRRALTPTIVTGTPFSAITLPTAAGDRPNRRAQYPSLITATTGPAPGTRIIRRHQRPPQQRPQRPAHRRYSRSPARRLDNLSATPSATAVICTHS